MSLCIYIPCHLMHHTMHTYVRTYVAATQNIYLATTVQIGPPS